MKYLNLSLKILLITNGVILLAGAILGPIYALFVEKIGGNILDAGITGGVFALAAGGAILGGFVAFRFGFNALFLTMAIISILSALYILFLPRKIL